MKLKPILLLATMAGLWTGTFAAEEAVIATKPKPLDPDIQGEELAVLTQAPFHKSDRETRGEGGRA